MSITMNQTKGTVSSVKNSDVQFTENSPVARHEFKSRFCGLLVALIFAVAAIVFVIALQTISTNSR